MGTYHEISKILEVRSRQSADPDKTTSVEQSDVAA